ncbi:peroxisomal (S)-2-hydroxy-acid oxidase GLO3 [Contarinia nasturtii]|uniref:peroxisomal (S)-2-hydroxy-acid oxidase GLO3 n=1 Tax=Contarinia nasturtii TaxID=265458 RepID=UPI0012D3FBE3|nr:peroxisomal (S)-2-hydroxy-acid oxidase GLO3 [Contarinia nasturtii]
MALVCVSDYEKKASEILPKTPWDYYRSGAGAELTLKLNESAYKRIRIRPRVLIDVSKRNTKCNLLGIDLNAPILIAPTAMQKMAHFDGEMATAKAAGNFNTIYTMSTLSTCSIEEVENAAPGTNKFYQLYIYKDRELTKNLICRAEKAGFKALVLTVDAPIFGQRRSDVRNKFELPSHLRLANFTDEKLFVQSAGGSGISEYVSAQFDATLNWNDVQWLVNFSKLPVILKGIMTYEDASLALKTGCKGIIVSNHGARQLDTVPATIEVLPEIVKAVGSQIPVMVDGGIRNGTDVFKALALGAKAIFVGRPILYGLAVNGEKGVESILNILRDELDSAMALAGITNISEINKSFIVHESNFCVSKL